MKKWFSAALCLLLMLALLVPAAAAEGTVFKIVPAQTEVKPGDTLTFTVQVESTDTCKSYGLVLTFDPAVFEVVSGECTAQNAALAVFEPTRGFAVMLNDAGSPAGELGSFTLKVKNSAAAGDAVISGESSVKNGAETIASQVVGATVRIAGAAQPGQTEQTQPTQSTQQTDPVPSTEGVQTTEPAGTAPAGDDPVKSEEPNTQTEEVITVGATAPLLGSEETPFNIWWLVIGGAVLAVLVILLIILFRPKKAAGGKYLRKG